MRGYDVTIFTPQTASTVVFLSTSLNWSFDNIPNSHTYGSISQLLPFSLILLFNLHYFNYESFIILFFKIIVALLHCFYVHLRISWSFSESSLEVSFRITMTLDLGKNCHFSRSFRRCIIFLSVDYVWFWMLLVHLIFLPTNPAHFLFAFSGKEGRMPRIQALSPPQFPFVCLPPTAPGTSETFSPCPRYRWGQARGLMLGW